MLKQTKEERTATLLTCLGADALEIVDGLNFGNDEERKDIDVVLENFVSAKQTNFMSHISSTNGIRSQASPLIRMLHHFALWRRRVIMVHFWIVAFATEQLL